MPTKPQRSLTALILLVAFLCISSPTTSGDRDPRWRRWVFDDSSLRLHGITAAVESQTLYLYGIGPDRITGDAGSSWQPMPRSISFPIDQDVGYLQERPAVVIARGVLHHAGNYSTNAVFYGRSEDLGASWSRPRRLSGNYRDSYRDPWGPASIAVDGEAIYVVWDTCRYEGFSNIVDCRSEFRSSTDGGRSYGPKRLVYRRRAAK